MRMRFQLRSEDSIMSTHMCYHVLLCRQDNYSKEDLAGLLEESSMPLQDLLARYNAPILLEAAEDKGG